MNPSYVNAHLLKIPGTTGSNYTGISLGGFEISPSSYLVALSNIDLNRRSEVYLDDSNGKGERNIVLLACDKNGLPTGPSNTFDLSDILSVNPQPEKPKEIKEATQVVLTDYIGHNKMGSIPYLVKLSEDRFLVLWEEFEHTVGEYDKSSPCPGAFTALSWTAGGRSCLRPRFWQTPICPRTASQSCATAR